MTAPTIRMAVPFTFNLRPTAVPGHLRPTWRITTIVLILSRCHRAGLTLKQLHVVNWALRDTESRETFLATLGGQAPQRPIVRIEPSLGRALELTVTAKLIRRSGARFTLTEQGEALARTIEEDDQLFQVEKEFFDYLGRKLTGKTIESVLEWNLLT
jgi:hypothetical protein